MNYKKILCSLHTEYGAHESITGRWIDEEITNSNEWIRQWTTAEGHAIAEQPIGETTQHDIDDIFHHDIHFILDGNTARFQHTKSYARYFFFEINNPKMPNN